MMTSSRSVKIGHGGEANDNSEETLEKEEPEPARAAVDTSHLDQPSSEEGRDNSGDVQSRPESCQSDRQLPRGVEVGRHEDNTGNKTTLESTDQSAGDVEGSPSGHEGLKSRYKTPANHEGRQNALEAISLGEELNGEFSEQEAQDLNGRSVVVIIRIQAKISQKVVSESVTDVSSVQLQAKELLRPTQKLEIGFAYNPFFFFGGPRSRGIPPMAALVGIVWW
ncbi:hypothetical protein HG530_002609 [Fusarium avenaceum]|nr:hypothetical protein HG530_002609 [Fusarium avenaceum]